MRGIIYLINNKIPHLITALIFAIVFTFVFIFIDNTIYNKVLAEDEIPQPIDYQKDFDVREFSHKTYTNNSKYSINFSNIDYRTIVIDHYLWMYDSPLQGLGRVFVEKCVEYGAPQDCTAVVAIAHYETNLCNYGPSQRQKNCWGWGGAGENRWLFSSYEEGIDVVTYRLVNRYGLEFMRNPEIAEMTYCGPRPSCAVWGDNVVSFMNRLNNLSVQMGYPSLFSQR